MDASIVPPWLDKEMIIELYYMDKSLLVRPFGENKTILDGLRLIMDISHYYGVRLSQCDILIENISAFASFEYRKPG